MPPEAERKVPGEPELAKRPELPGAAVQLSKALGMYGGGEVFRVHGCLPSIGCGSSFACLCEQPRVRRMKSR